MQPSNDGHPYVEKIREETQAYVRKLIAENESLRVVVAELEAHNARLQRDLNTAQTEITLHQKQEQLLHDRVTEIRSESEQYLAAKRHGASQTESSFHSPHRDGAHPLTRGPNP